MRYRQCGHLTNRMMRKAIKTTDPFKPKMVRDIFLIPSLCSVGGDGGADCPLIKIIIVLIRLLLTPIQASARPEQIEPLLMARDNAPVITIHDTSTLHKPTARDNM